MAEKGIVLGAGESGIGTAILAKRQGFEVFVSDRNALSQIAKTTLQEHAIGWEENQHDFEQMKGAQWAMKSPGIPNDAPIVMQLEAHDIPIVSELEFAAQYTDALLIGITGSNGKTTTTLLTHHILKNAGLKVGLAGNIGTSFARQVSEEQFDVYVLEISSFQLDHIRAFVPHIAAITNITPDHLDRYNNDFSQYIKAKLKIASAQKTTDFLVYNADDKLLVQNIEAASLKSTLHPFGLEAITTKRKTTNNDNQIVITTEKTITMIPTNSLVLQGRHNLLNAMAAATIADLLQISKSVIRESLSTFQGVPHRLEPVLKIQKKQFINDSKATNVNAAFFALESMEAPTVWIAGGVDKGNAYEELLPLVHEKVKAIVCLGVNNEKLFEAFEGVVDIIIETQSMEEAVKIAAKIAQPQENVLLSPACASFDLFENYEDRGNQFKTAIRNL
jgi:UDP-N-acetylmuramoylalanine--D-glutamate ligase